MNSASSYAAASPVDGGRGRRPVSPLAPAHRSRPRSSTSRANGDRPDHRRRPRSASHWTPLGSAPPSLVSGHAPTAPGEVAIDAPPPPSPAPRARRRGRRDHADGHASGPPVVGTFRFGQAANLAGASMVYLDTATAQRLLLATGRFSAISVAATTGTTTPTWPTAWPPRSAADYQVNTKEREGRRRAPPSSSAFARASSPRPARSSPASRCSSASS